MLRDLVPLLGHTHPAPPWPELPGAPLGLPVSVAIGRMASLVGAVLEGCRACTLWQTQHLLDDNPAPIAALAAQTYANLPLPDPAAPRPVRLVAASARGCVRSGDYRAVMHAVVMLSRRDRGIVAADLADIATAVIRAQGAPPPPPVPLTA